MTPTWSVVRFGNYFKSLERTPRIDHSSSRSKSSTTLPPYPFNGFRRNVHHEIRSDVYVLGVPDPDWDQDVEPWYLFKQSDTESERDSRTFLIYSITNILGKCLQTVYCP